MATVKSSAGSTTAKPPLRPVAAGVDDMTGEVDALRLLQRDHQEVAILFDEYEDAEEVGEREALAADICEALTIHAQIEEELFYPAVRQALTDDAVELVNEADIEHSTVKNLVGQIEASDSLDEHFDATVMVLRAYVSHHVEGEESELFPKVEETDIDLTDLGQKLAARKAELKSR